MIIARFWKPIAIVALIVAAASYRAALIHQRDSAHAQVAKLSARVMQLEASNDALNSAIAAQNAAVAELRDKADRAAALAHAREQAAARRGTSALDSAAHRAAELSRAPIASGCEAAIRWGNAQAAGLAGW